MADSKQPVSEDEKKYQELVSLYNQVQDYFLHRYMKVNHNNMDMKIRVLKGRLAGLSPPGIGPDWDTVQEEE